MTEPLSAETLDAWEHEARQANERDLGHAWLWRGQALIAEVRRLAKEVEAEHSWGECWKTDAENAEREVKRVLHEGMSTARALQADLREAEQDRDEARREVANWRANRVVQDRIDRAEAALARVTPDSLSILRDADDHFDHTRIPELLAHIRGEGD